MNNCVRASWSLRLVGQRFAAPCVTPNRSFYASSRFRKDAKKPGKVSDQIIAQSVNQIQKALNSVCSHSNDA
jgi:hypothetical protein